LIYEESHIELAECCLANSINLVHRKALQTQATETKRQQSARAGSRTRTCEKNSTETTGERLRNAYKVWQKAKTLKPEQM